MTSQEAERKALESRPNHKVVGIKELEKCFVVNVIPNDFDMETDDLYIGGGIRVDKQTGECRLYNPMLEGMR